MSQCPVCQTPLEIRGERSFCPACMLKDLWTEEVDEPEIEEAAPTLGSAPLTKNGLPMIPRHRVMEKLGEGGFAIVYRAMQLEPVRREVAVKVLRDNISSDQVLARFESERQTLARMEHPGIARLWDAGQTLSGQPFFAMELVRGVPITNYVSLHRMGLEDRLGLFIPVCHAVQHAHEKGVLHRDLKPSNLLVDDHGQVRVIDFGIAKALEISPDNVPAFTTSIHQAIGTPGYMSPEQAEWGSTLIDARSDIYALGVLLFELVTGRTPLEVEIRTNADARRRAVASQVQAPSRIPGNLLATKTQRRDLDAIILKALERESELRYPSAAALSDEVMRHLSDQPVEATQHSVAYIAGKFARRYRGLVTAVAVAVLAVFAGLASTTTMFIRQQRYSQELDKALHVAKDNADEIQRRLSRENFAAAQRYKELKDYQSAVASLTRSLESDPTFGVAGADLQTLMAYGDFIQPLEPALKLDKKWGTVTRGAVSGDGRTLAVQFTANRSEQRLMLWQRIGDSWQEREMPLEQTLTQLVVAGTGKLLVHVESGHTACITDLGDSVNTTRRWKPESPISGVTVDMRGSAAFVGCRDGSVWRVFADAALQPELVFRVPHPATHLNTTDSIQGVTVGCDDGGVYRWTSGTSEPTLLVKMPAAVAVLAQMGVGGSMAVGDQDGFAARSISGKGASMQPIRLHSGAVTALAIAGESGLISAGKDLLIRWFDMDLRSDLQPAVEVAGPVQKIDFARSEEDATFVTMDASVRQWRRGDEAPLTLRKPQRSRFVAMSVTGRCLVVLRDDGAALEMLSLAGHSAARMMLHPGGARARASAKPRGLAFAADGDTLLCVDGQKTAIGWSSHDAEIMHDNVWPKPALAMQGQANGKIAAALLDGSLVEATPEGRALVDVCKATTGESATPPAIWGTACISPNDDGAAWAETSPMPDKRCLIRLFRRGKMEVLSYTAERVSSIGYDAEANVLLLGLHNGTVRIIEVGGLLNRSYAWHLSTVTSLALSKDGHLVITGSSDGTIALWDRVNGAPRSDYLRLGKPVRAVTFSGDGRRFAVATDESVIVGDVATRAIIGPRLATQGFGGALALDEHGTRVAVSFADGVTQVCQIAADTGAPPEWFNEMARTFIARRFTAQGVLWSTENPELGSIQQSLPNNASGPWNLFSRWLLDHPGGRTLTPWSSLTLGDYLETMLSRPGEVATSERRKYAPDVLSLRDSDGQP